MITGDLKSKIDRIWDAFWSGGISNPLEVIEQITYLLFIRRLDDLHTLAEKKANRLKRPIENPVFKPGQDNLRWSRFKSLEPAVMHKTVGEQVFPFLRSLGGERSTYSQHMKGARFTIPTPQLLSRVVDMLDHVPMQDRDTNGDLYEYMLSKIAAAGQNGQFRTPRHIIQLMVAMTAPKPFRYDDLSEEDKDEWDALEWGDDGDVPDVVAAEELNRWLFNADTVDKVLATLMTNGHRVAGGDRIGKTIIFAKNNAHAEFIKQRFDLAYPEYAGHHARVITYQTEYAQSLIDDFSIAEKAPHIAISVDMLDTGIDIPEVVNLVFFKLIRAKSKFWQMIGRGTRLCPDLYGPGHDKKNFYVFDFCQNLEFFNQPTAGSEGSLQKSLAERLFEARLGLVTALDKVNGPDDPVGEGLADGTKTERGLRTDTASLLHQIVQGMNVDNFVVRSQRRWVETYAEWDPWEHLTPEEAGEIAEHLSGLPSAVRDEDEGAKRFDLLVLRIQLAKLDGDHVLAERLREQVQEIAAALLAQGSIPSVAAQQQLLDDVAGEDWWVDVTLPMLELARRRIRGLVGFIEKVRKAVVYTDFEDELGGGSVVELPGVSVGTNWERFKAKARAYLREHEDHVALQRLRRNKQLTPEDLGALEQMLIDSGAGDAADIARAGGVTRIGLVHPISGRTRPSGGHRRLRGVPGRVDVLGEPDPFHRADHPAPYRERSRGGCTVVRAALHR